MENLYICMYANLGEILMERKHKFVPGPHNPNGLSLIKEKYLTKIRDKFKKYLLFNYVYTVYIEKMSVLDALIKSRGFSPMVTRNHIVTVETNIP